MNKNQSKKLCINMVLEIDVPSELGEAFKSKDDVRVREWCMAEVTKIIDQESNLEFAAQILGISTK